MKRKFGAFLCLFIMVPLAFAEKCPDISAIKSKTLTGWKIYDSDDGTTLSKKREAQFIKNIEQFALAEWTTQGDKAGSIRCYYRDHSGSSLEAYLAKAHFKVSNSQNYWYEVSGSMHCAAGMEKCEFENSEVLASN